MKYLKKYNESKDIWDIQSQLIELSTQYLIDLVDMGFEISTQPVDGAAVNLRIDVDNVDIKDIRLWNVYDRLINLLYILEDDYIINGFTVNYSYLTDRYSRRNYDEDFFTKISDFNKNSIKHYLELNFISMEIEIIK